MTREFDHVRDAFARSLVGRILAASDDALARAWRTSTVRRQLQFVRTRAGVRSTAIAVAVAALMQPLLISTMSRTVAPAMPWWAFVAIGLLSLMVAWQADAVAASWSSSRLRRLLS
jgi:hypothetical protein